MASLTYMIYKANLRDKEITIKSKDVIPSKPRRRSSEFSRELYSSFRQKSMIVENTSPRRCRVSVGTTAPRSPKLRDLIQDSGILKELEDDDDMQSILEEEVDNFSGIWNALDNSVSKLVDQTLKDVMDEVLTMDDQSPIPCKCSNGRCLYHPLQDGSSVGASIPSYPSKSTASFEEIPHYCVPQFQPEYLISAPQSGDSADRSEIVVEPPSIQEVTHLIVPQFTPDSMKSPVPTTAEDYKNCSPPRHDPSQPSRSKSGRPPLSGTSSKAIQVDLHYSPEEDEEIHNSSHVPSSIRRLDSLQSYQSILSEVTLPWEMQSLKHLKIDPRAPQFLMAQEQDKQEKGEVTVRTKNHSSSRPTPPGPFPPTRRPTPPDSNGSQTSGSPNPPARKETRTNDDPHEITPNFGFPSPEEEEEMRMFSGKKPLARKGTVGGIAAAQPVIPPHASQPQGPFVSPGSALRPKLQVPSTPEQESNPHLYPANLLLSPEESTAQESILGPFVSPSAVKRPYVLRSNTPTKDSNPHLFPRGLRYYPPSPKIQAEYSIKGRDSSAKGLDVPKVKPSKIPNLLLPLDNDDSVNSNEEDGFLSETAEVERTLSRKRSVISLSNAVSIRVKLSPREITYFMEGKEYVHVGLYSGPINRDGEMHGNGVFWFSTGDVYLGQFCEDQLHGVGIMSVKSEDGEMHVLKGFFKKNEYIGEDDVGCTKD